MGKYLQLMCKDILVAERIGKWKVIHSKLLPSNLDFISEKAPNSFIDDITGSIPMDIDEVQREKIIESVALSNYRNDRFTGWLSKRILSVDRVNAKKILNFLHLSQNQSPEDKAKIALTYRAVSICDSWWIKFGEEDNIKWEEVNLFKNSLSNAMSLVALSGGSMTLEAIHGIETGKVKTAELSTRGSFGKGWFREEQGGLYLYKTGKGNREAEREVCASKVIDYFNIYGNLQYSLVEKLNPLTEEVNICSKCKLMSNEDRAIVHASEVEPTELRTYCFNYYKKEFSQMVVIDYLICNPDRHKENWGFFRNMITGEIEGLHPLYDHNLAFEFLLFKREDYPSSLIRGLTMREAAEKHVKASELKLIKTPNILDFPSQLCYEIFTKRCKQLNLF